jgi:hypothetical protein
MENRCIFVHVKGNQSKTKAMNHFKFEHDCNIIPATLTIEVSYNPYYREADWENPSEFDFTRNYELYCGNLNVTECILLSNFVKLQDEIDTAINEAISEHFFNL